LRNILKYQLPPILWILVTIIFAYIPDLFSSLKLPLGTDKIVHAGVYFVLCWLVQRAFYNQVILPPLKQNSFLGAFVFCCVYGILDEFHQHVLPGRASNMYDVLAAGGGALFYVAIVALISRARSGGGSESES
jgi:VanZ family protein